MQIEDTYCTITLTQGKEVIINLYDLDLVSGYAWYAYKKRNTWYAAATYKDVQGIKQHVKMHRLILGITDPSIKGDHINHNGLDNTRNNLRIATSGQNSANVSGKRNRLGSIYIGVQPIRYTKKDGTHNWYAQIKKDGATYYGGSYTTEREAAIAYNNLALQLHGNFASLNTIPK